MKSKYSTRVLTLILSVLMVAGCATTPAKPTEAPTATPTEAAPIKVGLIAALGDVSGINGQNGALLAEKEINAAGGVLGRPLKVIVVDDEMTPEKGAAAVDKLATVDNVDAFVINSFSGVHMAQIPALKKYCPGNPSRVQPWAAETIALS